MDNIKIRRKDCSERLNYRCEKETKKQLAELLIDTRKNVAYVTEADIVRTLIDDEYKRMKGVKDES